MKKFWYIPLAALMLTACAAETEEQYTTAAATETTPLTLTESITTEYVPEPAPEITKAKLAAFDPFSNSVKIENKVWDELAAAVVELANADMILGGYYEYTGEISTDFCDENTPLEINEEDEYTYCPVNKKYAKDEEELYSWLREKFTRNYLTDEELRNRLFAAHNEPGNRFYDPDYKTIDGRLCVKSQYSGVPYISHAELLAVEYYNGENAEIISMGNELGYPPICHVRMKLCRGEAGKWQLDGISEPLEYFDKETAMLYNILYLKQDKLNEILGGGTVPEKGEIVNINGYEYAETDLDMTVEEMEGFFDEMFGEYVYVPDDYYANTSRKTPLLDYYKSKYVGEVYAEQNGRLYRRTDAPKRYMPKLEIDKYSRVYSTKLGSNFVMEQPFYEEDGSSFKQEIIIFYKPENGDYMSDTYDYIYLASELPIKELP